MYSALKIALYTKKFPKPNKNDPGDFTTVEKESRTIFSVQQKKTENILSSSSGGQFSENKRDGNGVEWDVCMITKTYSSVLKLF